MAGLICDLLVFHKWTPPKQTTITAAIHIGTIVASSEDINAAMITSVCVMKKIQNRVMFRIDILFPESILVKIPLFVHLSFNQPKESRNGNLKLFPIDSFHVAFTALDLIHRTNESKRID